MAGFFGWTIPNLNLNLLSIEDALLFTRMVLFLTFIIIKILSRILPRSSLPIGVNCDKSI